MTCKDCIHVDVCEEWHEQEMQRACYYGEYFKNKADFVEVVRCEKCGHYEPHGNGKKGICRHPKVRTYIKNNTDFCSYGERKEEK